MKKLTTTNKSLKFSFLLITILSILFCSCKKDKTTTLETNKTQEKQITIGLSIDTLAIERWIRDCDVFLNTAKELGAHVIVQNAGNSIEEQEKQIKYLIDKNVDSLVILPKKADSLKEVIQKAKSKNIPVISYDRLILNANIDAYITVNSERVGEYMALTLSQVQPQGTYFCIYGPEEDYNMTLIDRGVRSILEPKQIDIAFTFYTDSWNYDLSYQKMSELLQKNLIPDAIICGNDAVAGSVIKALSEYQLAKKIPISGQDADISACQSIVEDKQTMTVYKPITELAKLTAQYAYKLATGKKINEMNQNIQTINNGLIDVPVIWLEPSIVTKKNIDDIVIKSGFHTHGEVYRN